MAASPEVGTLLASRIDLKTVHDQAQSSLFSTLPPEVRTTIFRFALRPSHDKTKAYEEGTFYYRPTHTSSPLITTTLLLTCRRVYLEIALLLCSQNTLTYWWDRPPPGQPQGRDPSIDLVHLSPEQRSVTAVQVFIQQFHLEGSFRDVLANGAFRPAQLTITLRHGDWWNWEQGQALGLDAKCAGTAARQQFLGPSEDFQPRSWGSALQKVAGLKVFVLELETVTTKKAELDNIVKHAMEWEFHMVDGTRLVCDPRLKKVSEWSGVNRFYEIEHRERIQRQTAQAQAMKARRMAMYRGRRPPMEENTYPRTEATTSRTDVDAEGDSQMTEPEYVEGQVPTPGFQNSTRNLHAAQAEQTTEEDEPQEGEDDGDSSDTFPEDSWTDDEQPYYWEPAEQTAEKLDYYIVELLWKRQDNTDQARQAAKAWPPPMSARVKRCCDSHA